MVLKKDADLVLEDHEEPENHDDDDNEEERKY